MTEAWARHLGPEAAAFGDLVFSLHDADALEELMRSAGFREVDVERETKSLRLPAPADFLWQYIRSTPLAAAAAKAGEARRAALEREVCERLQGLRGGGLLAP